jgi:hypothetical protein
MTARQALWVLWPEGPNTRGRIEVGGILFCGYWGPHRDPGHLGLRQFCSLWPHETVECAWVSLPEDYSSRAVAVKILAYPSTEREWQTHVEASLHWFVAMGALISWCGHEMVSASIEAVGPDGGGRIGICRLRQTDRHGLPWWPGR